MSSWQGSNRRDRLPADWQARRKQVLRRDQNQCQSVMDDGETCGRRATEVDHVKRGDDHRLSNLAAICTWHHGKKSSLEGNIEKWKQRKAISQRYQRAEDHPGLL